MQFAVVIIFVAIFALVLLSASLGFKYFEARRKRQVQSMLQTVAGAPAVTVTKILRDEVDPEASVVEQMLTRLNFADRAKADIQQAGMDWTPTRLVGMMAVAAVAGGLLGLRFNVLLQPVLSVLALAAAFACLPYVFVRKKRRMRLNKMEEQFPEALDFLARSMRAGHAFSISLEMLGEELEDPLGAEFRTLFNEQNLGAPLEIALRNLTERVPLLDVRFFATSVMLQKQTGGNLSEILSRLAYVIRERFRLKGQVKAASAHGRLTATILIVLPIVTMVLLMMIAPDYLRGMAADPDGKYLIIGAIAAQLVGNYCIKKIINIKV